MTKFKDAFSKLASGVSIVTVNDHALAGLTINSLTSLSVTPELLLFCVNKNSFIAKSIINTQKFSINILSSKQEGLARLFATKEANKFNKIAYQLSSFSNAAIFTDNLVTIDCNLENHYPSGDHFIIIGQLKNLEINASQNKPLIYYNRKFINEV